MAQVPINVCRQLVALSSPRNGIIWMRIEDAVLEPAEAEAVTSLMYQLAKPYVNWNFPNRELHFTRTKYCTDPKEYERLPEFETEKEYDKRLKRLQEATSKNARLEEQWLRRACIVIGVLNLLHTASQGDYSRLKTKSTSFNPRLYYEYFWICLKGGNGVRAWDYKPKSRPRMPAREWSYEQCGQWCCEEANRMENMILQKWHEGELLESLTGELVFDDLIDVSNKATVASVRAKLEDNQMKRASEQTKSLDKKRKYISSGDEVDIQLAAEIKYEPEPRACRKPQDTE